MRIHSDDKKPKLGQQPTPPPPNYGSRKVQVRLLAMILAFGTTVYLMNEARKPENWRWFTALDQQQQAAEEASPRAEPDTRLHDRPQGDTDPPGIIYMDSAANLVEIDLPETASSPDPQSLARYDAWKQSLEALSHRERRLFDRIMLTARGRGELDQANVERRKEMLSKLDRQYTTYLQEAFQAVVEQRDNLSDEEKTSWLTIIQQMESSWENELQPALLAVSMGNSITPEQEQQLAAAQAVIDRVNLDAITDNTITRHSDAPAWFRLLEQLEHTPQSQLMQSEIPTAGFIELFDQPDTYRGKLVQIEGTVKLAKRVRPPPNPLGIEEYYLFWLKPAGSSSPMAIYTLELPEEFPELDFTGIELDTHASFRGYFFKRWVYQAGDGPRIAPVMLAKIPTWTPEPATTLATLPNTNVILLTVAGAAALGVLIALVVYLTAKGKSSLRSPYNTSVQQAPQRLAALEQQPAPLTAGERLEEFMSSHDDEQRGEA